MGLSLTPITHVSASPLFDPGRSVSPSPVLTLAYSLGRLPIASEAQVLTHIHPYPQWFTPEAVTATAHKLARIIYAMLKNQTEYRDPDEGYYEERARQRAIKNLERKAKKLGLKVVPLDA